MSVLSLVDLVGTIGIPALFLYMRFHEEELLSVCFETVAWAALIVWNVQIVTYAINVGAPERLLMNILMVDIESYSTSVPWQALTGLDGWDGWKYLVATLLFATTALALHFRTHPRLVTYV